MSKNYIETILDDIRSLTPNHPTYQYIRKEETYTQKQWAWQMKVSQSKENLRKKSTRLDKKKEVIATLDDLDKILNIESKKQYTKKWKRLGKRFKINRLMDYYDKSYQEIMKIYNKINHNDIDYDEKEGKIKNINNNIFENE